MSKIAEITKQLNEIAEDYLQAVREKKPLPAREEIDAFVAAALYTVRAMHLEHLKDVNKIANRSGA